MKQFVIAGTLAGALACGVTALAQTPAKQPPPAPAKPAAGATKTTPTGEAQTPDKPAKPRARRPAAGSAKGDNAGAGHTGPKDQPNTAQDPNAQSAALALGSVRIPKSVKADGKDLAAGTYQVRLTADEAKPDAKGSSEVLERWVEFVQKGQVKGREVVSIVPAAEAKLVQKDTPPPSGGSRVETLKGGDYTRLWINKGGNYYLVHFSS
jgi:hypothetical protein